MDNTDRQIVALLHQNGRLSQEQIAQHVHLSRPAVHERIKHLEEQDILRGYQAVIDWSALNLPLMAFVWVRAHTAQISCNETSAMIMGLSWAEALIEECHRVTGEWCMLLKVRVASPLALQNLIDRIRALSSVEATNTTIVLSTLHEHGPQPQEIACSTEDPVGEKKA